MAVSVGRCRKSVGTAADASARAGPSRTNQHQRSGRFRRSRVTDPSTRDDTDWTKSGFPTDQKVRGVRNPFGDQPRPPVTWQVASKPARGAQPEKPPKAASNSAPHRVPPRCPPRMTPGRPGGQLATHATHAPVTDGAGHAFAMRRSGVRIPAAPPPEHPAPPAQTLKPGRGFVIVVCPSCVGVRPRARSPSAPKPDLSALGWSESVD